GKSREILLARCSSSTSRAFRNRRRFGNRRSRIPLHWRFELDRFASECFHDFRRDGTSRSAPIERGEAFRFVLCLVFGARFHRYGIAHCSLICASAFAPLSRRREVKMPQLLTY